MYKSLCIVVLLLAVASLSAVEANDDGKSHHPVIVAQRAFLQATGPFTQDLFTPEQDGDFRIEVYENQQASSFGPIMQVIWTDELGTQEMLSGFPILVAGTAGQKSSGGQIFVHALAGNPIQLTTSVNLAGQPPYNIRVTVERM